jgi:hypothetical protein
MADAQEIWSDWCGGGEWWSETRSETRWGNETRWWSEESEDCCRRQED